jgi:hypothetical protein
MDEEDWFFRAFLFVVNRVWSERGFNPRVFAMRLQHLPAGLRLHDGRPQVPVLQV